ncbi:MAG: RagB/SusD family nutrient uptake outer membrane protein [Bacteroidota bacterium]|nr:RagB/SusD family nutrient uptake outer membrane protein [Bacteroidota bacterium]
MKKIIYLFAIIFLIGSVGCESALDKKDLSSYIDTKVWSDSCLAQQFVDYIYDQNQPGFPDYSTSTLNGLLTCSEERTVTSAYFAGTASTADATVFGTSLSTTNVWTRIRQINMLFDQIDKGTISRSWRNRLKGQAYFFRAWRYWEMVNLYGGVPLILTAQNAVGGAPVTNTDLYPKRNSTSECITQILADLDSAAKMLPGKWANYKDYGRITKGAVLAFKGRILLTYASPLFNPSDLSSRWKMAYEANKAAKDTLDKYGYGLFPKYASMFLQEVTSANAIPSEAVFVTCYNTSYSDNISKNNSWTKGCIPGDYGGSGNTNAPTWDLVKAYPMVDGKAPGASSTYTYSPNTYFKNRDPRFYASIGYNGCWWTIGGATQRIWTYYNGTKSIESSATGTGFYCKKMADTVTVAANLSYVGTNWMEIRYAEVLLNLAESACGYLGPQAAEATKGLLDVRARAGIQKGDGYYGFNSAYITTNRDSLFKAILWERQIEFALEGKRWQDLRRWKLFDNVAGRFGGFRLNGTTRLTIKETFNPSNSFGITATNFKANVNAEQSKLDMNSNYTNFFNVLTYYTSGSPIAWLSTYYFLPIPSKAIENDPNLEQNIDWGGTFDPLN